MRAQADLVVRGAVYTVDAARSWTDAVAVRDGRIVAIGAAAVADHVGARTRVIDAGDGLVLPGFTDAHVHVPFGGRNRNNLELNGLVGRTAYLDAIAAYATARPDEEWIVGGGWALEYFPGGAPDKADLDAIVGDRPVFLFNRDVHGAWVNSAALARAGIDASTPDPSDGRIERDPVTGEPSGMLQEGAAYSFEADHVPAPSREDWQAAILTGQAHLHSLGITAWQDAWVTPATLDAYRGLAADGRLRARVVGALWWDRHRGLEQIVDLQTQREQGAGGRFFPTTVKIMVDGVLENQTGALLEPYCVHGHSAGGDHGGGDHGSGDHGGGDRGLVYVDADVLRAAVTALDALGFQVHLHTIGDRAVRIALDAVEAARAANGPNDHRHHLAHVQVIAPEDIARFRTLGVTANCQAFWAQSEPQMDELTIPILGRERAGRQYQFGDLFRAGTTLAMGSDWPVTTADPLAQLEVAVTRTDPGRRATAPFLPEQALPLPVAVAAFTAGSAWINHDDDGGTIAVGRRADLAVLDRNLFTPGVLPADASVRYTVAAGEVVHEA